MSISACRHKRTTPVTNSYPKRMLRADHMPGVLCPHSDPIATSCYGSWADLLAQHDKFLLCAPCCDCKSKSAIVRSAVVCHRTNEGGIDGELCPVPKRQAIANDLNQCAGHHGWARRCSWRGVQRCGRRAPRPPGRHERRRVGGVGLGRRARRMWSRQLGGLHTHQVRRGRGSCGGREEWVGAGVARDTEVRGGRTASARAECGPACARRGQVSKVRLERALVASMGGSALPAAEEVGWLILLGRGVGAQWTWPRSIP